MTHLFTLAQAVERVASGESSDFTWAGFLDAFYSAGDPGAKRAMLAPEPRPSGDIKLDCLAAAIGEYLWKQNRLGASPKWFHEPDRVLPDPWFTTSSDAPGIREYLSYASPAEFVSHNIFTDEAPLRRARSPRPSMPSAAKA